MLKKLKNEGFTYAATPKGLCNIETTQSRCKAVHDVRVNVQTSDSYEGFVVNDPEETLARLVEPVGSGAPLVDQAPNKIEPLR